MEEKKLPCASGESAASKVTGERKRKSSMKSKRREIREALMYARKHGENNEERGVTEEKKEN